jgi:hypothetical protein
MDNFLLQILEWLSNMPVDLEGYIRSGCTILTLFVSMPQSMWEEVMDIDLICMLLFILSYMVLLSNFAFTLSGIEFPFGI